MTRTITFGLAMLLLALTGCSTIGEIGQKIGIGPGPQAGQTAEGVATSPAERKLAEGVALYDKGEFAGAIRALQSPEIGGGDVNAQVRANKYLAFSYCVTQRRTLCRRSFDNALLLDDSFELQPAEAGHPIWGPVYAQARKAAQQRRAQR